MPNLPMAKQGKKHPTWKKFINTLEKHGVKIKRNWKIIVSASGKSYRFCELEHKQLPVIKRAQVSYQPSERISKYTIRSICNQLGLDSMDIEFELL